MIGYFPAVLNFNQLFLKLNRFIDSVTNCQFSPIIVFVSTIECEVVINIWRCSPISFERVSSWCSLILTVTQTRGPIKKMSHPDINS